MCLALFMFACTVAQANRFLLGGSCPSGEEPKSDVSLFQTNLVMNLIKVAGEDKPTVKQLEGITTVSKPLVDETENITANGGETIGIDVDDDHDVDLNVTRNTEMVNVRQKQLGKLVEVVTESAETVDRNKSLANSEAASGNDDPVNRRDKGGSHDPDEPFATEHVTVHNHTLNITRLENIVHESQVVTVRDIMKIVNVAGPYRIASIYIVLFAPILVASAFYYHYGQQVKHYALLLPVTMCCATVGFDLVNQSLALILEAPHAITAMQAIAMCFGCFFWSLCANWSELNIELFHHVSKVRCWVPVAVSFAIFQIVNHIVYAKCSLSERSVVISLCPLVMLITERLIFSESIKPVVSFNGKVALGLMVVGAVLFSIQSPSFTLRGVGVATCLLFTTVPYRLGARKFLVEGPMVPISVLVCIDGLVVGVSAFLFSAATNDHLWTEIELLLDPSVMFMLFLSVVTLAGAHISSLAMLRCSSATSYQVFQTTASFVTIIASIMFFGDRAIGTPLASIGIVTNIASGIWYAVDGKPVIQSCDETKIPQHDAENHDEPQKATTQ